MDTQKKSAATASPCAAEKQLLQVGNDGNGRQALNELRQELVGGLLYTHTRANANTGRVLEAASFLYALIEVLEEKGLITIAEVEARKDTVAERLKKRFVDKGMGVNLQ